MKIKKIFAILLVLIIALNLFTYAYAKDNNISLDEFNYAVCNITKNYFPDFPSSEYEFDISEISTNRLIVKTYDNEPLENNCDAIDKIEGYDCLHVFQYTNATNTAVAYEYFSKLEIVEYVDYDFYFEINSNSETLPSSANLWGYNTVNRDEALELMETIVEKPKEIVVAVIDSGLDYTHKDIANRAISSSYNFYDNNSDMSDEITHGTLVSGVILFNTPDFVKIKPYKVFGDSIQTSYIIVCNALQKAVDENVDVINMSLYGECVNNRHGLYDEKITNANQKGIPVIVAAGNNKGDADMGCPANHINAITVSAINSNYCAWENSIEGSNYGDCIDIGAPGSRVYTTYPGNIWDYSAGTSMAAPFVSAAAAMIKSVNPDTTPTEIEELIKSTAFVPENWDTNYGVGIVNFMNILEKMRSEQPTIKLTGDGNMSITSSATNTEIYYTLDGTDPVYGESTLYTEPFNVWNTDTVKTIAFTDGMLPSEIRIFNMITQKDIELKYKDNTVLMIAPDIKHAYSTDKDIVTVDVEGNVCAVSPGEAQLIIRLNNGKKYIYNVTVEIPRWRIISLIFYKLFNILLY